MPRDEEDNRSFRDGSEIEGTATSDCFGQELLARQLLESTLNKLARRLIWFRLKLDSIKSRRYEERASLEEEYAAYLIQIAGMERMQRKRSRRLKAISRDELLSILVLRRRLA